MKSGYQETIELLSRGCDLSGRWKPSEIFLVMQELGGRDSQNLGWGDEELRSRDLAFVLTRNELHMKRYPVMGQKVVCHTWATAPMKSLFPRYFLFTTEEGDVLGTASSLWALMSLKTRHMMPAQTLSMDIEAPDMPVPMALPARAQLIEQETERLVHRPSYEEIDVNGHVNNTRYVAWICDALGVDAQRNHSIATLTINYVHEILPGEEITLHMQLKGDTFCMSGEVNGMSSFLLSGKMQAI